MTASAWALPPADFDPSGQWAFQGEGRIAQGVSVYGNHPDPVLGDDAPLEGYDNQAIGKPDQTFVATQAYEAGSGTLTFKAQLSSPAPLNFTFKLNEELGASSEEIVGERRELTPGCTLVDGYVATIVFEGSTQAGLLVSHARRYDTNAGKPGPCSEVLGRLAAALKSAAPTAEADDFWRFLVQTNGVDLSLLQDLRLARIRFLYVGERARG